ncbi:hypothetical protein AB0E18_32690, partial [Streptomyces sp. NPDC047968]
PGYRASQVVVVEPSVTVVNVFVLYDAETDGWTRPRGNGGGGAPCHACATGGPPVQDFGIRTVSTM